MAPGGLLSFETVEIPVGLVLKQLKYQWKDKNCLFFFGYNLKKLKNVFIELYLNGSYG